MECKKRQYFECLHVLLNYPVLYLIPYILVVFIAETATCEVTDRGDNHQSSREVVTGQGHLKVEAQATKAWTP